MRILGFVVIELMMAGTLTLSAECSGSPRIENYATVESVCDGVPVYSFSNITYVYGVSPDFLPGIVMQKNNTNPFRKIIPKKSWEIKHNLVGANHEMTPKTLWNDIQPYLPIHLIDGNPDTIWCSWGCLVPDGRPEWIRIDLPAETTVASVAFVCSKNFPRGSTEGNYGRSLPKEIQIKLSRDAWHWEKAYDNKNFVGDLSGTTVIQIEPRPARQILITANNFQQLEQFSRYIFSVGEVEVRDATGENIALISRGATVTVSSKTSSHENDRITQDALWAPLQFELGVKWVQVGGDNGSLTWCYVEHEKGKLVIDQRADEAVSEVAKNGVNVIFVLDFKGNWIYMKPPRRVNWKESRYRDVNTIYDDRPPHAHTNLEMYQAYLRWVETMVRHFKDRVTYFEIGNEWAHQEEEHRVDLKEYMEYYFEPIYKIIKKMDPNARVMLGSASGFMSDTILECLSPPYNIGPKIDGINWHQGDPAVQEYFEDVKKFKKKCADLGFKGEYFVSEIYGGSHYPPGPDHKEGEGWPITTLFTEIGVTKYLTRILVGHNGLDIEAGICHPHFSGFGHPQSLVRPRVPVETVNPCQPTVLFYAWRTIATIMDDFYAVEFPVLFKSDAQLLSFTWESGDKKEYLLAAWIPTPLDGGNPAPVTDEIAQAQCDITVKYVSAKKVWAIDIMNGTEQELDINRVGNSTIIEAVMIKDYPTFIKICK